MGSRDEDIAWFRELLAPIGQITVRRMFGGAGVYADGLIVGLEVGGALYLKTDDQTRQAFADAGGQPFVYDGKGQPVTMSYWTPPEEAMDSPEAMQPWARLALAASLRAAAAKPARAKAAGRGKSKKRDGTPGKGP
ncbi:MAG: TfoX/Sxy family protein [Xanthomonadaceae bacterium]|nr:TfoX/Sxy family protein [Xanthomonadaceae bacterium]